MIEQLNKLAVHEHLLERERIQQLKTKPKINMENTRNGRWLAKVRKYFL